MLLNQSRIYNRSSILPTFFSYMKLYMVIVQWYLMRLISFWLVVSILKGIFFCKHVCNLAFTTKLQRYMRACP
jgi:hypothetical protein